ncbi:hypothetical protein PILCRDRAFT_91535 [Piloderma croceum F 1598]|uniref:Uncharacterized protein n=1 Tax=Piloderma croceum (strain F 1598) TaxID=765440 RepID=A0A0C3EVT7_PILCF|nr:hypothetical protein PILCRDRAFT_91535 [Piloderma croceum F 1598]
MSDPPSTPSVKTPIKVVCTCTACAKLFFINQQGEQQPGQEVASSTRTLHRKKDRLALAEHSTPAVEPEHDQATPDQVDVSLADGGVEAEVEIIRRGRAFDPRDLVENGDDTVWLHLKCGLSRTATNQTLKVLGFIVVMAINFGHLLAHSDPYHDYQPVSKPDPPRLPHDSPSFNQCDALHLGQPRMA